MERIRVIEGAVSVLDRPDVDTDQIVPKQFLKRLERRGFGEFLFYDWAREPGWSLPSNPILATGRNFGCGSSREQAPWALHDYGFRAIVASSFADIFYANCSKVGLLPVPLPEAAVRKVMECGIASVDLEAQEVICPGLVARFDIDPATRERLLNGLDEVSLTLQKLPAIEAYESSRRFVLPDTSRM
jgi:3-isopropylmalate/(R)-2-methylmalate dehydratase small subunit